MFSLLNVVNKNRVCAFRQLYLHWRGATAAFMHKIQLYIPFYFLIQNKKKIQYARTVSKDIKWANMTCKCILYCFINDIFGHREDRKEVMCEKFKFAQENLVNFT